MSPKTLYDKIWDAHVAHEAEDGTCLLYIDRHLVHEVTSPQAFEGLRMAGRKVRAPEKTIAVPDHNVPTTAGREDPANMTAFPMGPYGNTGPKSAFCPLSKSSSVTTLALFSPLNGIT